MQRKEVAMGLVKEFKEFALRGNMIDLAIAVVIGAAFAKIITSFVDNILMPPHTGTSESGGGGHAELRLVHQCDHLLSDHRAGDLPRCASDQRDGSKTGAEYARLPGMPVADSDRRPALQVLLGDGYTERIASLRIFHHRDTEHAEMSL